MVLNPTHMNTIPMKNFICVNIFKYVRFIGALDYNTNFRSILSFDLSFEVVAKISTIFFLTRVASVAPLPSNIFKFIKFS